MPNERGTSLSPFSRTGTDRERGHGSKKGGVESRGKEGDRVIVEDKDSSLVKSTVSIVSTFQMLFHARSVSAFSG